ncbi:O-antigen ligase family protein [Caballeronia sp. BR00000012568055]|uniref:O-antigen ligase family protein n=1 Tax=Caballeronia sp. BR00000012568055 TaxID=2918761 RepID=UPI0023F708E8|nr:O-antigen ligase family protein [Caballeronia sp. BR00000012568055]
MKGIDFRQVPFSVIKSTGSEPQTPRHIALVIWAFLAFAFILTPIADFLTVRGSSNGDTARYSLVVRGLIVIGLMFGTLVCGKVRRESCTQAFLAIVAISAAGITCLVTDMSGKDFAEQATFILKVFSFFIYIAGLLCLTDKQRSNLEPLVLGALLVYAMTIVVGAIFSVDMFRSYQADTHIRSGYEGIVYAQNEASALMISGLAYAYARVLKSGWTISTLLPVIVLSAASLLIGTKAAAAGALVVVCIYFYARHRAIGATLKASSTVLILLAIVLIAYASIPSVRDAVSLSQDYFMYHYEHARGNALLTILLSGRDEKFAAVWADLSDQNFIAVLSGGYPITRYFIEIDIPDLILCLGLPAFCFYLVALRREFVFDRPNSLSRYGQLFFWLLLAVACTAGHILNSAVTSPYLAFLAVLIRRHS